MPTARSSKKDVLHEDRRRCNRYSPERATLQNHRIDARSGSQLPMLSAIPPSGGCRYADFLTYQTGPQAEIPRAFVLQ